MCLSEVYRAIAKRNVFSEEVVRNTLVQLEKHGSCLIFLVLLFTGNVLYAAKKAYQELSSGNSQRLIHGIPLTHKDMFYRTVQITACGSKICEATYQKKTGTILLNLEQVGSQDLWRLHIVELPMGLLVITKLQEMSAIGRIWSIVR